MPPKGLTSKAFWSRIDAAQRLAALKGARFEDDTDERQLRRMAEAVVLPEAFNKYYLGHYFRGPAAPFHRLMYLALTWERHIAIRVPRGHAKSTVTTFAYSLHQVVCAMVLRAWSTDELATTHPALAAEIEVVMAEEARRRIAEGPLTVTSLGLPEHWDPKVDAAMNGWLAEVYERQVTHGDHIPLHWDPYIQIVSSDGPTALEFTSAIRAELEGNELIRSDWGDLKPCYSGDWGRKHRRAASDEDFESNGTRIRAFGMDQDLRGGKHGPWRPTLAIFDDPDGERTARTASQRDANCHKVERSAEPGLEPDIGRILLCGTPHHPDAMIVRFTEHEKYRRRYRAIRFRAADEKGRRLYASRFSAQHLADIKAQDPESYESEYGDRPPAIGGRPFTELHYYSRAAFAGVRLPKVMAFDPSLGRTAKSDFQALVTLRGPTEEGKILVDRARFYRIGDWKALVGQVNNDRGSDAPDAAYIEAISHGSLYAMLLDSDLQDRGMIDAWIRIERQEEGKDLRIRSLAPLVNGGVIVFPDDGSCRELELQFLSYGQPGAKRDGPDVTEMALRPLRDRARGTTTVARHQPRGRAFLREDGRRPTDDGPRGRKARTARTRLRDVA